ncbi:hypothetical protein FLONG3_6333 [Fusarium longipes]|uniref:Uncharacterized protein n=1 Tax=Fusarium longipes TaxID=694270 RepID=A0A395SMI5_9HYPO|nr:hypothetical protein FLONG3_6333 [Fusarium longipes]
MSNPDPDFIYSKGQLHDIYLEYAVETTQLKGDPGLVSLKMQRNAILLRHGPEPLVFDQQYPQYVPLASAAVICEPRGGGKVEREADSRKPQREKKISTLKELGSPRIISPHITSPRSSHICPTVPTSAPNYRGTMETFQIHGANEDHLGQPNYHTIELLNFAAEGDAWDTVSDEDKDNKLKLLVRLP